jgi:peptidoglycan-N-acetylglucosamine deacetylase
MKKVSSVILFLVFYGILYCQPKISFTFDDGKTADHPPYMLEEWNRMLLDTLAAHNARAVFFVKGSSLDNERGREVLKSWNEAGHIIANHTYSHWNYNTTPFADYRADFLKNDSLVKQYSNFTPMFRFPYLKEGESRQKIDSFRLFLDSMGYRNGHVTIDASDWYIDSRLTRRLKENPVEDLSAYKKYYLNHIYNRALFYDSLAVALTGRQIHHTLLLHHNLSAGLFMGDLIRMFKEKGWEITGADEAYKDEFFNNRPSTVPAGESLVYSLAKETGKFDAILRYPAEDARYEKEAMDKLGL